MADLTSEDHSILNGLCAMSGYHDAVESNQLRRILLATGGQILCRGRLREIKSKHLGAGVYRVSTELKNG